MPAYKIIACDMDETLLSSDASICQRNIEAIQKAVSQGVKFVPCTGRGFRSVEGVLTSLVLTAPVLRKTKGIVPYFGILSLLI